MPGTPVLSGQPPCAGGPGLIFSLPLDILCLLPRRGLLPFGPEDQNRQDDAEHKEDSQWEAEGNVVLMDACLAVLVRVPI